MQKQVITIAYEVCEDISLLKAEEKELVQRAIEIAQNSYSPYSKFPVGAAVLLDNGQIFVGSNQENISYPAGTCAERTVLNYVHANFPADKIRILAVTTLRSHSDVPATPCGFCRQVMVEMEQCQDQPIRVLLHKLNGDTYIFDTTFALLPLAFYDDILLQ